MNNFRLMKIAFLVSLFTFLCFNGIAQSDTVITEEGDTAYYLSKRNSLGANISPMLTTAFGGSNKPSKVTFAYKRNFGDKNLRVNFNYLNLANRTPYYTFNTIGSTDSSVTNRYYGTNYKHYDIRIGFEELKGANFSQFHIGADLILGYAQFMSDYTDLTLDKDSADVYRLIDETPLYEGSHMSEYFMTGLDVSFGFDWFLSEEFIITLQLTPQFNFFLANKEELIDQKDQYLPIENFADFSLGYFDIMLFYRF